MTPTPDTPPTPDASDTPAAAPDAATTPAAAPDAAATPAPPPPPGPAVTAFAPPPPPGPAVTAFAPPPPVGPAPLPPPAADRRSRLGRPVLAGAAALLVVAAAFGGGFATGRSTAPDGDRLTVELPAGWHELPGPGDGATRGGLPGLERDGRDADDTTPGKGAGDAGGPTAGTSEEGAETSG